MERNIEGDGLKFYENDESQFLEIKLSRCTLFLTEQELFKFLPENILKRGLERGKRIMRRRQYVKRNTGRR